MPDRTAPMTRTPFVATHSAPVDLDMTPRSLSTGPTKARKTPQSAEEKAAKRITRTRSAGWCEVRLPGICLGRASNWHHRKNRSQGGLWLASNGLHVCGTGTTGCHGALTNTNGRAEEFRAAGWIVPSYVDPAQVPVLIAGRFVLLADYGSTQDYQDQQKGA
jgi:hypothetical protein